MSSSSNVIRFPSGGSCKLAPASDSDDSSSDGSASPDTFWGGLSLQSAPALARQTVSEKTPSTAAPAYAGASVVPRPYPNQGPFPYDEFGAKFYPVLSGKLGYTCVAALLYTLCPLLLPTAPDPSRRERSDAIARSLRSPTSPVEAKSNRLLEQMLYQYESTQATVTSRQTGEEELLPSRRSGSKITFDSDVTHEINSILRQHDAVPFTRYGDNLDIDQMPDFYDSAEVVNHCDLLCYQPGDEFKAHRDAIPDHRPENHVMYTMLIGLHDTQTGGGTSVRIPDYGDTDVQEDRCEEFLNSSKLGGFVMFPSFYLHSGLPVVQGHKMCLKLDFWLKPHPSLATIWTFLRKLAKYEPGLVAMIKLIVDDMVMADTAEYYERLAETYTVRNSYYLSDDEDERYCNGYGY